MLRAVHHSKHTKNQYKAIAPTINPEKMIEGTQVAGATALNEHPSVSAATAISVNPE